MTFATKYLEKKNYIYIYIKGWFILKNSIIIIETIC